MGLGSSKLEKDEALHVCKERKRFIKQAIDSRYNSAAAHLAYTQSLRSIGGALKSYVETEILVYAADKTPLSSSYHPSPSPSHNVEVLEGFRSPNLGVKATVNCMRSGGGGGVVTMRFNPAMRGLVDEEKMGLGFSLPPPPPPLPDVGGSWDYFDTSESMHFGNVSALMQNENGGGEQVELKKLENGVEMGIVENVGGNGDRKESCSSVKEEKVEEELAGEKEDPAEYVTHRAKDFLSSIRDIEHRFFRASEAGREVARLLESNKIRVGYTDAKGSSALGILAAFGVVCCKGRTSHVSNEPAQPKFITWKRSTSSRSSSSKNPLTAGSKDENDDSGSEFGEEFSMFAGSHSSTLERLHAWERKLYDEVKASEIIMKEYDRKCHLLAHQFAKDAKSRVIDKTRAAAKDLNSRIRVALHSCNSISKRIEKMRDEELLPQLVELVQGLTRMWKAMLECHHAQYITISLAYHSKGATGTRQNDARRGMLSQLRDEVEYLGLSFANWINGHTSYVEALNGYLQNCIMLPRERSKHRKPFSPRRVLAPPIFVLIRDWSTGVQSLPSTELSTAIKSFLSDIDRLVDQEVDEEHKKKKSPELIDNEVENKDVRKADIPNSPSLNIIQASLTKVLDHLTKFSEASLKMYEDVHQKSEAARIAYSNCRQIR